MEHWAKMGEQLSGVFIISLFLPKFPFFCSRCINSRKLNIKIHFVLYLKES